MRRVIVIIGILAAVGVASWFGYQRFGKQKEAAAPDYETASVTVGDIAATVSATGSILPERDANLVFQSTGAIAQVLVKEGDSVKTGQLLAELDTADLELAVRQATIGLRQAEAQFRQLSEGASESDLAAARAALSSAQASYQQLLKGADQDQTTVAKTQLEQARAALTQAQQAYDQVKHLPNVGMMPQALQLQQATLSFQTTEAQYRLNARPATAAQLAASQAQVAQAQASLDRLLKGPSVEQTAIAQAGVDQAQVAVEQAQRRLANARLVAPWDAIVTAVNITPGTLAQPSAPAIVVADLSRFHLNAAVDEVDIAGIDPGQAVTIEIDALPDAPAQGTVQRVAAAASPMATGGVSYQVRIDIDRGETPMRAGMSATATIVASARSGVLLIPNRAVQLERESGRTFVERLVDGQPQRIEVRLGLRDEQRSEVREGLQAGDQLVIRNRSSLEQLQMSFGGGF